MINRSLSLRTCAKTQVVSCGLGACFGAFEKKTSEPANLALREETTKKIGIKTKSLDWLK